MATTVRRNPYLNLLLRKIPLLNRVRDPFVVQEALDRILGPIHWDFNDTLTRVKLLLITVTGIYYVLSGASLAWIDSTSLAIDHYFGTWFLTAAGGPCYVLWCTIGVQRKNLLEVSNYLQDLQSTDPNHSRRAESRPWIALYSMFHFLVNLSLQASFWAFMMMPTSSLAYVAPNRVLHLTAFALFPVVVIITGTMANVCQVTIFTTMFVFGVEFEILVEELEVALNMWNHDRIRQCIQRHQKLLDMAMLFRDKLKFYLLLTLELYYFLIVSSCVLLVFQLKERQDSQLLLTLFSLSTALIGMILFGVFCDRLDRKVGEVGRTVYNSAWPEKFQFQVEEAKAYRHMRLDIVMIQMRAQKGLEFTCGNLMTMSLETCVKIMQMCYSTFTLLMNVVIKD